MLILSGFLFFSPFKITQKTYIIGEPAGELRISSLQFTRQQPNLCIATRYTKHLLLLFYSKIQKSKWFLSLIFKWKKK